MRLRFGSDILYTGQPVFKFQVEATNSTTHAVLDSSAYWKDWIVFNLRPWIVGGRVDRASATETIDWIRFLFGKN